MNSYKQIVKKVIDYIEDNLENDMDMEQIAERIGYSKFHLNRIFAAETGCTIYKYLQARRLTVAAQELVDTVKPIAQIAYDAGYHSQQAFSLAFKQIYLYPPKTYRDMGIFVPKQNKLLIELRARSAYGKYGVYVKRIEAAAA